MKSINQNIEELLKPIFKGDKKKFLLINNLVKNWSDIVGKKNAKQSRAENISFEKNQNQQAKLTIEVDNSATGFVINASKENIIEKINSLYGFAAIKKIIIKQNPKKTSYKRVEFGDEIDEKNQQKIDKILANFENSELKETISKLGKVIYQKNK
jgi:hypothetical protein